MAASKITSLTPAEVASSGAGIPGPADGAAPKKDRRAPFLSVVLPTRNEEGNVEKLVDLLEDTAPGLPVEIIFVDDSSDGTVRVILERRVRSRREIAVVHREEGQRDGGLAGAVVIGLKLAKGDWVCVMDADLQHPPKLIEQLLETAQQEDADVVVASRFRAGGNVGHFGPLRRALSRASRWLARLLFPIKLHGVSDPMSGFFLVRRDSVDLERLRPRGFKILLEILARGGCMRVSEIPFTFGERHAGESKASLREGLRYVAHLVDLRYAERERRLVRFAMVGATGLLVNTLLLAGLAGGAGINYLAAAIMSTQGSSLWNFAWTERWVFNGRDHRRARGQRLAMFLMVNNAALALRIPILWILTSGLGLHYLVSNLISLVGLTIARYAVADVWIWAQRLSAGTIPRWHTYDIHGLVTIASEVRLPELERMRVDELHAEPTIRVRVGRMRTPEDVLVTGPLFGLVLPPQAPNGNGHMPAAANGASANGHMPAAANGAGADGHAAGTNGSNAAAPRLRYREGLGGLGFQVQIDLGEPIEVVAGSLLKRSPHVLYTNVVEPLLRWTFAELGFALVHAACIAKDGRAFLITARTDTGKTTTCLQTLDSRPYAFLSDDLVLVTPDGRVFTYPKPLTISRHTLHAVKTPLLTRRERTALVVQSRLHSRSGRRFAMFMARTGLPAATINAIVQLLVPPPKYQVDRLVPGVEIAPEAQIAGMVIIQRGGTGTEQLAPEDALDILLSNCEDAYGFPPYSEIEHFLHTRGDSDLRALERQTIANALQDIPTTLMRSDTMDWWQRLPEAIEPRGDREASDRG